MLVCGLNENESQEKRTGKDNVPWNWVSFVRGPPFNFSFLPRKLNQPEFLCVFPLWPPPPPPPPPPCTANQHTSLKHRHRQSLDLCSICKYPVYLCNLLYRALLQWLLFLLQQQLPMLALCALPTDNTAPQPVTDCTLIQPMISWSTMICIINCILLMVLNINIF